jgi:hypothetical protein
MDGSGPQEAAKRCGEQTVEEVRHLEDGTCRGGNPRGQRTRSPRSSKGHGTPGGEGLGREAGTRNRDSEP